MDDFRKRCFECLRAGEQGKVMGCCNPSGIICVGIYGLDYGRPCKWRRKCILMRLKENSKEFARSEAMVFPEEKQKHDDREQATANNRPPKTFWQQVLECREVGQQRKELCPRCEIETVMCLRLGGFCRPEKCLKMRMEG